MPNTVHIVIHQDSDRRARRRRAGSAGRPGYGLRDPEDATTLPLPDDPEDATTLPLPDDPEDATTLPLPDDPEDATTLPLPDDPEDATTLPLPDDPYGGRHGTVTVHHGAPWAPSGHGCGCPPPCCTCTCDEPPARPEMGTNDYTGSVVVRLAPGVDQGAFEHLWDVAERNGLDGLKAVLEIEKEWQGADGAKGVEEGGEGGGQADRGGGTGGTLGMRAGDAGGREPGREQEREDPGEGYGKQGRGGDEGNGNGDEDGDPPPGLPSTPLISPGRGRTRRQLLADIRKLEERARTTRLAPPHSLTRYWRVDLRAHPDKADELVAKLNALPEVELAYRELAALDPQYPLVAEGTRLEEYQCYLDDAPFGIGARWAWTQLPVPPAKLAVCDLEQRWARDHQDFTAGAIDDQLFHGANRDDPSEEGGGGHHGTAVLGQLAAAGLISGGAHPVGAFSLSSHYLSKAEGPPFGGTNGHVAAAILHTLLPGDGPPPLERGDVLLLEVQRAGLPTEIHDADFDAIRLAAALGVVVVEAAGNGGRNLDRYVDPDTGRSLRRGGPGFRDSGAILVGAAWSVLPHDRAPFSNHGSRVDCFAWGDSVTSSGYGDLAGTSSTDFYTDTFSGTSSASPIVAAAAALVQALTPSPLDSLEMRALLSDPRAGTPQGPNVPGRIGVMPDLKRLLRDVLRVVPDVYVRCHPGDDGSRLRKRDPISSSPDVLVVGAGKAPGWPKPPADHPAPGARAVPGDGEYDVHVRLRNRGMGEANVTVRVFASPAATLIPPERWQRLEPQGTDEWEVLQGDVPLELDPIRFAPPAVGPLGDWSPPPYSFLVVARPTLASAKDPFPVFERCDGLPPGGAYFDWRQYRAFLRSRGVAWRNVHVVEAGGAGDLPFFFAGTPDSQRRFTFEVVQRLPAGSDVLLKVPPALAAKLRRTKPLLEKTDDALRVPSQPRTVVPDVALPPGCRARASFAVEGTPPGEGHSLALRQLWKGEEVGRITWYFRKG